MAIYYLDEDLTTGLNDGTSWVNAYQLWDTAVDAIPNLSEDSTLFVRSTGVVDAQRTISSVYIAGYTFTVEGDNNAIIYSSVAYSSCLSSNGSAATNRKFVVKNIEINTNNTNAYGFRTQSDIETELLNVSFTGISKRSIYATQALTDLTAENCVGVGSITAGVELTTTGTVTIRNSYFESDGSAYLNSGAGAIVLETTASDDATGSTGLQNIPYDGTTFTSVISGSEDFHLVSGSSLIGTGTATSNLEDKDGDLWGTPRDVGIYAYTTTSQAATPDDLTLSSIILESPIVSYNSNTFSYDDIVSGFSGYYNFVDEPTERKFGKNAIWFGEITGKSSTLKCGGGSIPYTIFVDGVLSEPTQTAGELTVFTGLSDVAHSVGIVSRTSQANLYNYIETTETEVFEVFGSNPTIEPLLFDYVSDPTFKGLSSYSTGSIPYADLTPTYNEIAPWGYEFGQIIIKATCDEIWLYTANLGCQYSIDGGDPVLVEFTEDATVRRAVMLGNSFDDTQSHTYTIWGNTGETFGIQGVLAKKDGALVSLEQVTQPFRKTLVLGSSVVEGSADDYEGYADTWLYGKDLDLLVTKAGNSGNTTVQTTTDYPSVIASNGIPDIAIFGSSTNDNSSVDRVAEYTALINAMLSDGIGTIICRGVVPYFSNMATDLETAVDNVANENVYYVDSLDLPTYDSVDGTHPTPEGYVTIADYFTPFIDEIINTGASPNDINLSGIILEQPKAYQIAKPLDLTLSTLILEQALIIAPASPNDLMLSSLILGQTRETSDIVGLLKINFTASAPNIIMVGDL